MGGAMSRNKGQRAERDVIKLLQPILDRVAVETNTVAIELTRNLAQAHKGGDDVWGLAWLSIEVKHQETYHLNDWWEQAKAQARGHAKPVLFYRRNGVQWTVRMLVKVPTSPATFIWFPADLTLGRFLHWFEIAATHEAQRGL
jgi:hypothetical protein